MTSPESPGKYWRNILLAAFALFYGVYFVRLMLPGLQSWFSGDDLLNIHYAWSRPFGDLIRANILFFNHYSRPMGELTLFTLYSLFGFNPAAFNVFRLVLCILSVVVLYVAAAQLSRSREVAVLAVLLAGFNPALNQAYYDSGMIFDPLAFVFYYSAFALYVFSRREGRMPGLIRTCQIALLYIVALDSKEIAVSLPVALLLYELTMGSPVANAGGEGLSFSALLRRYRVVLVTGLLTLIFIIGKNVGSDALSTEAAYHPIFSLSVYLKTYAQYAGPFALLYGDPSVNVMGAILVGCLVVALLLRNRVLLWASLFNLFAILPVAFIPLRNGFECFVPFAGWGIYGAALLADLRQRLLPRALRRTPVARAAGQLAVAAALFFLLLRPEQRIMERIVYPLIHFEQFNDRDWWNSLRSIFPPSLSHKRILGLNDPLKNAYHLLMMIQLGYGDPTIGVDTSRTLAVVGSKPKYEDYDYVIDYDRGKFRVVTGNDLRLLTYAKNCSETHPLTAGKYDDTNPGILFQGIWTRSKNFPSTYGKTIAYSNAETAEACLSFEGTGLRYFYTRAFNRGLAEITIDGNRQPLLDLYSPVVVWQWSAVISGLSPGRHDVAIGVTGQKNPRSQDTYVDLDAVEVF